VRCQGCGTVGSHRVVYGVCRCRAWPLAMPEAGAQMGRCGYCGVRPKPPFFTNVEDAVQSLKKGVAQ
jgi:hypothetical protein